MVSYNPPKLFLHLFRQYLLAFTLAALEETKAQCDIFADNVVANQVSALDNSFPLRLSKSPTFEMRHYLPLSSDSVVLSL